MHAIILDRLRKCNDTTYTDKVGTILQFDKDYAHPLHPYLFTLTFTNGQQLVTRDELAVARRLKQ